MNAILFITTLSRSNILIFERNGVFSAKIADFGYAILKASTCQAIVIPGHFDWASPESCKSVKGISPARDIYSLGLTILCVLSEQNLLECVGGAGSVDHQRDQLSKFKTQNGTIYTLFEKRIQSEKSISALLEFAQAALIISPERRMEATAKKFGGLVPLFQ